MICRMGLGRDPARPTSPHPHKHSLTGQTRTNHSLPSGLHIVSQQLPVLPKARLHPALPARRRRKMKGRQIPGSEAVLGRKSRQPLPPTAWDRQAAAAGRDKGRTGNIHLSWGGRERKLDSQRAERGWELRQRAKARRTRRDRSVLWDLGQQQGSGHRVRAWLRPAVSHCQAG